MTQKIYGIFWIVAGAVVLTAISITLFFVVKDKKKPVHEAKWNVTNEEPCDQSCGGGLRYRNVTCQTPDGKDIGDKYCTGPKPSEQEKCNTQDCEWEISEWSECVDGKQTRNVTCPKAEACKDDKPSIDQKCGEYSWQSGEWSKCSVPCGTGAQTRDVWCWESNTQTKVENNICKKSKPDVEQKCTLPDCMWHTGEWRAAK